MNSGIGYVLSGGGARGFAHLGVLQYLEEAGIRPSAISGVSAGAIAGALYAGGLTPEAILKLLQGSQYFGWSSFAWQRRAIFTLEVLKKLLIQAIPEDDFSALKIPFFAGATDILTGEPLCISSGNLSSAVCASAAVPLIFEPVQWGTHLLVDGGVMNNFPVEPLADKYSKLIGVHVNKLEPVNDTKQLKSPSVLIDRCFHLAIASSVYEKAAKCDIFIDVPLQHIPMFDIKQARKIFDAGYAAAKEQAIAIKQLSQN